MIKPSLSLSELGPRICILGPSNSGKSTLAAAISRKLCIPAVHLDQLFHEPHTDWVPRPEADFAALHAAAIDQARWVMDGNYSKYLPLRFQRATGLIVLNVSTTTSLFRYLRRTLFERGRYGALEGASDSIKWDMIRHITVVTPRNRERNNHLLGKADVPTIMLPTKRHIEEIYGQWGLSRHARLQ